MSAGAKIARLPDPPETGGELSRFATRHFTVGEIAAILRLSDDAVRDLFRREPGVLAIGRDRSRGKRSYLTLRIPQDVFERVCRRLQRP
jgi:hypothetical protein